MPTKPRNSTIAIVKAENFSKFPWLVHGFSTRPGGASRLYGGNALNLGFIKQDSRSAVERNRELFLRKLGAVNRKKFWPMLALRQIHSDLIHCVAELPKHTLAGDGLITATPELLIGIQTADCLPVILVDVKRRVVGAFHAGWRGTVKRIVEKGVGEMRRCFGTQPKDIRAAIGPGVHECCYRVGEEVRIEFESQFAYSAKLFRETKETSEIHQKYPLFFLSARAPGHTTLPKQIFLDLVEANRRQLLDAGVSKKNISASELCTVCRNDLLFSYRAENGTTGRLMAVAGIRPK